jgi:histidyl-tRNA synthetase
MAKEQGPMSGFRDMLAEQMIPRQQMISTIQEVYERYGFTPLKTPALERASTLVGKYGEEGDKLMYKFEDNGGREVALRYDQTVPLARVVAQHAGRLPMPYKRYTVGEAWRGERPQSGRYREFTQFDADIVGTVSPVADAEIVAMMSDSMEALGADSLIRVNNRRILDGLAETAGVTSEQDSLRFIATIDKVEKVGVEATLGQIEQEFSKKASDVAAEYLNISGTPIEKLKQVAQILKGSSAAEEGIDNLTQVFTMLEALGYGEDKIVFDQLIARGLDYYTGIVYETTLKELPGIGSVCSGGRFDRLVKAMGGPDLPAVGTSIGVDRLYDGLKELGLLPDVQTNTEVLITAFNNDDRPAYLRVAAGLRQAGIATEIYYEGKDKLKKQFRFADTLGIPFVVLMGPDEVANGVGQIKSLASGKQIEVPIDNLTASIQDFMEETKATNGREISQ